MIELKYPPEFIAKVGKLFGEDSHPYELAAGNRFILGRYLDDCSGDISVNAVLSMDCGALKAMAQRRAEIRELYAEWGRIYRSQEGVA